MSATGLTVFDETLHLTNIWLNDIMEDLGSRNVNEKPSSSVFMTDSVRCPPTSRSMPMPWFTRSLAC